MPLKLIVNTGTTAVHLFTKVLVWHIVVITTIYVQCVFILVESEVFIKYGLFIGAIRRFHVRFDAS